MKTKNEVLVLGTIHSQHKTSELYGLEELKAILKNLNPDYIFAEMPPESFQIASKQFQENGKITEARILQYPEFSDVVFPLSKEMNFEIIPVSAWTLAMANARDEKLEAIKNDASRAEEWNEYQDARKKSAALFNEHVTGFSPEIIHTPAFDAILNIELSVFDRLFNDDLGKGGWTNINTAHYALIEDAFRKIEKEGKRIVIIFGSGHKGWLLNKLGERDDVQVINLLDVL